METKDEQRAVVSEAADRYLYCKSWGWRFGLGGLLLCCAVGHVEQRLGFPSFCPL